MGHAIFPRETYNLDGSTKKGPKIDRRLDRILRCLEKRGIFPRYHHYNVSTIGRPNMGYRGRTAQVYPTVIEMTEVEW